MAKVKVEVLGAVVDGAQSGDTIEIDVRSAEQLASIGYVKILKEQTVKAAVKESAPKSQAKPKASRGKDKE